MVHLLRGDGLYPFLEELARLRPQIAARHAGRVSSEEKHLLLEICVRTVCAVIPLSIQNGRVSATSGNLLPANEYFHGAAQVLVVASTIGSTPASPFS